MVSAFYDCDELVVVGFCCFVVWLAEVEAGYFDGGGGALGGFFDDEGHVVFLGVNCSDHCISPFF